MDRPSDSQAPAPKEEQDQQSIKIVPPSYRSLYLIFYNSISALLWTVVLGRVLLIAPIHGTRNVYLGVGDFTKWTQTMAALEVVHAAVGADICLLEDEVQQADLAMFTGLVRAPLLTTLMQVASRFLLVWGIADQFPAVASFSPAYSSMLVAWSVTEVIRYSYFAVNLAYGGVPDWMLWLRYNTFFVLYPLGISSECWLVWLSRGFGVGKFGQGWDWFVRAVLFIYIPGAYVLFTHMMAQRRKVMRGMEEKKDS